MGVRKLAPATASSATTAAVVLLLQYHTHRSTCRVICGTYRCRLAEEEKTGCNKTTKRSDRATVVEELDATGAVPCSVAAWTSVAQQRLIIRSVRTAVPLCPER